MFVKRRRIQIGDPVYTERDYEQINNPRRMIFLTDILRYIIGVVISAAVFWGGIYVFAHAIYAIMKLTGAY